MTNLISVSIINRPYRSFLKLKYLLAFSSKKFVFIKKFFFYNFNIKHKFKKKLRSNIFFLLSRTWVTGVYHIADLEFF